jgi:hypothetical protein
LVQRPLPTAHRDGDCENEGDARLAFLMRLRWQSPVSPWKGRGLLFTASTASIASTAAKGLQRHAKRGLN